MDDFLIKKPKLSEKLFWLNTKAYCINVKALFGPKTSFHRVDNIK